MSEWNIDIKTGEARHSSGLILQFEGVPESEHFSGLPRNYAKTMNPLELSRLIREGYEHYCRAWRQQSTPPLSRDVRRTHGPSDQTL